MLLMLSYGHGLPLFTQNDEEGHCYMLSDEILDHCTDGLEIKQQDSFIFNKSRQKHWQETTKRWELLVSFEDGSMSWVALKDMSHLQFRSQNTQWKLVLPTSQDLHGGYHLH